MGLILGWGSLQLCQSLVNEQYIFYDWFLISIKHLRLILGGDPLKVIGL